MRTVVKYDEKGQMVNMIEALDGRVLKMRIIIHLSILFAIAYLFYRYFFSSFTVLYFWTSIQFMYVISKIVLSLFYKKKKAKYKNRRKQKRKKIAVSVIIASYNEDVSSVELFFNSLLRQKFLPDEIFFVDDGSESPEAYNYVKKISDTYKIEIHAHRFKKNRGKKEAQVWGFKRAKGDLFFLVDTDSTLHKNAIRELVKCFQDEDIGSAVGHILPRNAEENFLTKMQDIKYFNSFRCGRGAQSVLNSVLVCSGAISMHRREIVLPNLDQFLEKEVFGIPCVSGDDRCLTSYSLQAGYHTIYQLSAICYTDVPSTLNGFFKQRVRWTKSSILRSWYCIFTFAWKSPIKFIFLFCESSLWFFALLGRLIIMIKYGVFFDVMKIFFACVYFILVAQMSSIYYVEKNFLRYLVAFFYAFFYGILLSLVRIYALATIKKTGWNTR